MKKNNDIQKKTNNINKRDALKKQIVKLSVCAMLVGISVVIGSICRAYLTFGVFIRITFENLPIILSSILFGPIYGLVVGVCTDLISCVITAQTINPIITLGAMYVGLVAGTLTELLAKAKINKALKVIVPCVGAHILGCMLIKTFGLWFYYFRSTSFWYLLAIRVCVYTFISAAESFVLFLILKNKYIKDFSDYEL